MHCAVVDIADGALDLSAAMDFVADPGTGGVAVFVGKVRDLNQGLQVTGVSYDMFDPLALTTFARAVSEADALYGPALKAYVAHARGRLAVGDLAVIVAVGTPHRDEAFRACRSIIEAIKHRAPIWKQEHYLDGDSVWSEGCSLCDTKHDHDRHA